MNTLVRLVGSTRMIARASCCAKCINSSHNEGFVASSISWISRLINFCANVALGIGRPQFLLRRRSQGRRTLALLIYAPIPFRCKKSFGRGHSYFDINKSDFQLAMLYIAKIRPLFFNSSLEPNFNLSPIYPEVTWTWYTKISKKSLFFLPQKPAINSCSWNTPKNGNGSSPLVHHHASKT